MASGAETAIRASQPASEVESLRETPSSGIDFEAMGAGDEFTLRGTRLSPLDEAAAL